LTSRQAARDLIRSPLIVAAGVDQILFSISVIDAEGNVADARVLKGLPMGLDRAAVDAVQKWKFKPATLKGKPVKVYYTLTVNFKRQ